MDIMLNLSTKGRNRIDSPAFREALARLGAIHDYNPDTVDLSHDEFIARAASCDVMVASWGSRGLLPSDCGRLGRLKLLVYGAGTIRSLVPSELIADGLRVNHCSRAVAKAVAHYAVGLIVLALRDAVGRYLSLRDGVKLYTPYRDLDRVTVGIVGLSRVGSQIPELLVPFGCRVLAYDPFWTASRAASLGVELVDLDALIEAADVVTLHAPVLPQTEGMINADRITAMKPGSILINTARGALIDQEKLFERCYRGEITAYLDVTVPEPLPQEHPAWKCRHVFITPHISGPTEQSMVRIGEMIVDTIRRFKAGEPILDEITLANYPHLA